jgi:hypothetical protein
MIKRIFYRRLERLEASVLAATRLPVYKTVYAHLRDGKPAGSSVIGPDGRHVWWEPPEGCKEGEPVEDSRNSHLLLKQPPLLVPDDPADDGLQTFSR